MAVGEIRCALFPKANQSPSQIPSNSFRLNLFRQLPFQGVMIRLGTSWKGQGYCMPLLTEFYQPVFESGYIKTVHFIPGWEKSFGAKWEHEQCGRLGIERIYLPEDFLSCL